MNLRKPNYELQLYKDIFVKKAGLKGALIGLGATRSIRKYLLYHSKAQSEKDKKNNQKSDVYSEKVRKEGQKLGNLLDRKKRIIKLRKDQTRKIAKKWIKLKGKKSEEKLKSEAISILRKYEVGGKKRLKTFLTDLSHGIKYGWSARKTCLEIANNISF